MIEIEERRQWNAARILLLIGPGGAGKSSLGSELAPLLNRRLVDLDHEFCRRVEDITTFMRREGYERYKTENSALAARIAAEAVRPTLLVASSGFLTDDNPETALKANRSLLEACYSVCLLPSRQLERAVYIIVERQLARPFAREMVREEAAIRHRYDVYSQLGDLAVFSAAPAADIAKAVQRHLSQQTCLPPEA
jgi:shikimate kinase